MKTIDWSYHRPGLTSCRKTQEFLASANIKAKQEVNAKKDTHGEAESLALVKQVNELYAAKGKKVVHIDLKKEKPGKETLKSLLLGPTGNLRAPTLRIGKKLIVGFNAATYSKIFG